MIHISRVRRTLARLLLPIDVPNIFNLIDAEFRYGVKPLHKCPSRRQTDVTLAPFRDTIYLSLYLTISSDHFDYLKISLGIDFHVNKLRKISEKDVHRSQ